MEMGSAGAGMNLKNPLIEILRNALAKAARGMGPKVYHRNIHGELKQILAIDHASMSAMDPQGKQWSGQAFHIKNKAIGFFIMPWELDNWAIEDDTLDGHDILVMARVKQKQQVQEAQGGVQEPLVYRLIKSLRAKGHRIYLDFVVDQYAAPSQYQDGLHVGKVREVNLSMDTGYDADHPEAKWHQLMHIVYHDPLSSNQRPVYDTMTIYSHIADRDMDLVKDSEDGEGYGWRLQRREN